MEHSTQKEPLLRLISEIEKELLTIGVVMDETDITISLSNIKKIIKKYKQQYKNGQYSEK